MGLLFALIILCSGFIVVNINKKHYYRLHRYEGQFLYIKCATLGIKTLLLTLPLFLISDYILEKDLIGSLHNKILKFIRFFWRESIQLSPVALDFILSVCATLLILLFLYFKNLDLENNSKLEGNTKKLGGIKNTLNKIKVLLLILLVNYLLALPLIKKLFNNNIQNYIIETLVSIGFTDLLYSKLSVICVLSLVFAYLSSHIINFIEADFAYSIYKSGDDKNDKNDENDDSQRIIEKSEVYKISVLREIFSDSPLDMLLMDSYVNDTPIMFHMNDHKVYVGIVLKFAEPNEAQGINQEISIVPVWSGYRKNTNFKVIQNTVYPNDEEELFIVLKQSNIQSATMYEESIFMKFGKVKESKVKQSHKVEQAV